MKLGDFLSPTLINNLKALREEMCQNSLTLHEVTAQKERKLLRDSLVAVLLVHMLRFKRVKLERKNAHQSDSVAQANRSPVSSSKGCGFTS